MGPPNPKMRVAQQNVTDLHTKCTLPYKDKGTICSEWRTEMRLAHHDKDFVGCELKMKFEGMFPEQIWTMMSLEVLVKSDQDVANKFNLLQDLVVKRHVSKSPMCSAFHNKVDDDSEDEDQSAFQSEWKMAQVVEAYTDKTGTVRHLLVQVRPNQDGSIKYKPSQGYQLKMHIFNLLLLVPDENQENIEEAVDVEVEKVIVEEDVEEEKVNLEEYVEGKITVVKEDDVCDAIAPRVSSFYNSPDVQKQYEVAAVHEGEVDKEPGGIVTARRRSPRFGHTNA